MTNTTFKALRLDNGKQIEGSLVIADDGFFILPNNETYKFYNGVLPPLVEVDRNSISQVLVSDLCNLVNALQETVNIAKKLISGKGATTGNQQSQLKESISEIEQIRKVDPKWMLASHRQPWILLRIQVKDNYGHITDAFKLPNGSIVEYDTMEVISVKEWRYHPDPNIVLNAVK